MNRTAEYDEKLMEHDFFKNHPQMIPFVGRLWGTYKKLLVVGDRPYLPRNSSRDLIYNWYEINSKQLSEVENYWTSVIQQIDNKIDSPKSEFYIDRAQRFFRRTETVLRENLLKNNIETENALQYVSFINFFQRPSLQRKENMEYDDRDTKTANETLKFFCSVIKPDYLFILSTKSWVRYDPAIFPSEKVGHSCTPVSAWWIKKSKNNTPCKNSETEKITGKESFACFIDEHGIFGG